MNVRGIRPVLAVAWFSAGIGSFALVAEYG
jgi:hypothetical protein